MLELGDALALSFVDCTVAFDSISSMATIESLTECEASRKSIALVRMTHSVAKAQMRDGNTTLPVDRGALQGDRLSPVLFVVVLAAILKNGCGGGVTITGFGGNTVDVDVRPVPRRHQRQRVVGSDHLPRRRVPRHEDDEIIFEGTLPRLRLSGVMVRVITRVITHTHTHTSPSVQYSRAVNCGLLGL